MPPHGPAIGKGTAPDSLLIALLKAYLLIALHCQADEMRRYPNNALPALLATMHTDIPDWSLPAHRRRTLRGMDAA
jgi:hypothetical protein